MMRQNGNVVATAAPSSAEVVLIILLCCLITGAVVTLATGFRSTRRFGDAGGNGKPKRPWLPQTVSEEKSSIQQYPAKYTVNVTSPKPVSWDRTCSERLGSPAIPIPPRLHTSHSLVRTSIRALSIPTTSPHASKYAEALPSSNFNTVTTDACVYRLAGGPCTENTIFCSEGYFQDWVGVVCSLASVRENVVNQNHRYSGSLANTATERYLRKKSVNLRLQDVDRLENHSSSKVGVETMEAEKDNFESSSPFNPTHKAYHDDIPSQPIYCSVLGKGHLNDSSSAETNQSPPPPLSFIATFSSNSTISTTSDVNLDDFPTPPLLLQSFSESTGTSLSDEVEECLRISHMR
jgi:hypothetical protein